MASSVASAVFPPGPAPSPASTLVPAPSTSASVLTDAQALEFASSKRFHQSLKLPATPLHDELTVTYAVAGVDDEKAPMILFCGGMFCGRWIVAFFDFLARKAGVRICCIDR